MNNYKETDDLLVAGGSELAVHNYVATCEHWLEAWEKIKLIMESESLQDISEVDDLYEWCDFISNFVQDLADGLHNAGLIDLAYFKKRIKFCQELVERTKDGLIRNNARSAIAETYFRLGEHDEAHRHFESLVQDLPNWSWGYIHWADCYAWDSEPANYEKAAEILEIGLSNPDIEEGDDIHERAGDYFCHLSEEAKITPFAAKLQRLAGMVVPLELHQAMKNIQKFNEKFAKDEIICIREHRDEAIPLLLEFVAMATAIHKEVEEWHDDLEYHMYAMYLLSEFGVHDAFPLYAEILELDNDTCESILGDSITDGMGSLIGSVATRGDITRIKAIVENVELDPYQRSAAINALIVMCVRGIYERSELIAFLGHLLNTYSDDYSFASSVVAYCHDISAREHYPQILELYEEGALETFLISERDFEVNDQITEEQEALEYSKNRSYLRPISDTVKSMSWWACFNDEGRDKERALAQPAPLDNDPMSKTFSKEIAKRKAKVELAGKTQYSATPIIKDAKIGRNEPCPCGSGKKYKKCCINK